MTYENFLVELQKLLERKTDYSANDSNDLIAYDFEESSNRSTRPNTRPNTRLSIQEYLRSLTSENLFTLPIIVSITRLRDMGLLPEDFPIDPKNKDFSITTARTVLLEQLIDKNAEIRNRANKLLRELNQAEQAYARLYKDKTEFAALNTTAQAVILKNATLQITDQEAIANFLIALRQRQTDALDEALLYTKPNVSRLQATTAEMSIARMNAEAKQFVPVALSDYQLSPEGAVDYIRKLHAEIAAFKQAKTKTGGKLNLINLLGEDAAESFIVACDELDILAYYNFGHALQDGKFLFRDFAGNAGGDWADAWRKNELSAAQQQQLLFVASRWAFLKQQINNAKRRHRDLTADAFTNEKRQLQKAKKNSAATNLNFFGTVVSFLFALTCGATMGGVFFLTPALQIPAFLVPFMGVMGGWMGNGLPIKNKYIRWGFVLLLAAAFAVGTFYSGGLLPIIGAAAIGFCVFAANYMMAKQSMVSAATEFRFGTIASTKTVLGERRQYTAWEKVLGLGVIVLAMGGGLLNAGITYFGAGALVHITAVLLGAAVFQGIPLAILFGLSLRSLIINRKTLWPDVRDFFKELVMEEVIPAEPRLDNKKIWQRRRGGDFARGILMFALTAVFGTLAVIGGGALTQLSVPQVHQLLAFSKTAATGLTNFLCWGPGLIVQTFFSLKTLSLYVVSLFSKSGSGIESEQDRHGRLVRGPLNAAGNTLPIYVATTGAVQLLATPGGFAMSLASSGLAVPEPIKDYKQSMQKRMRRLFRGAEQRECVQDVHNLQAFKAGLAAKPEAAAKPKEDPQHEISAALENNKLSKPLVSFSGNHKTVGDYFKKPATDDGVQRLFAFRFNNKIGKKSK